MKNAERITSFCLFASYCFMSTQMKGWQCDKKQPQQNIGRWGTSNEQQWKNIEPGSQREIK